MSTPGIVRMAIAVSLCTTGGAIYYKLSEGGDPGIAQERLSDAKERLATDVERMASDMESTVNTTFERLKTVTETVTSSISKASDPAPTTTGTETVSPTVTSEHDKPPVSENDEINMRDAAARPYCHTCSGPRIWFFAEKLRLKRRFTPYPDPPRE